MGQRRRALLCQLIAVLAVGFSGVSAAAQVTTNFHIKGPFATEYSSSSSSTSYTSTYVNTGRTMQQSISGSVTTTTYVNYQVCVTTFNTGTTICEVGSGTIANSELTGDVDNGLGTPPKNLSLDFDSGIEPGYTVVATKCDAGGCSSITPSGGPITVNWRKNGQFSRTVIGTEEDRYGTTIMTKSIGQSSFFGADSWGTMAGTPITGNTSSQIGFANGVDLEVVLGPK